MRPVLSFWGQFLSGCLTGGSLPEYPDQVSPNRLVQMGNRLHVLEWFDWAMRNRESIPSTPEAMKTAARRQRCRTAVWNRRFKRHMEQIEQSIPPSLDRAWLKGGALIREADYPPAVRRLSDLDLLIRRRDLNRWHDVLTGCGFRVHRDPEWILSPEFDDCVSSTFYTRSDQGRELLLDLHWHLVDFPARRAAGPWDFDMEPLWDRAEDGRLAPEHRLLYISDHAFTHGYRVWKFLADLYFVQKRYSMNRQFLNRERSRLHQKTILEMSRRLANQVLGKSVKEEYSALNSLESQSLSSTQRRFLDRAIMARTREGDYLKICLELCGSGWSKLGFLFFVLLPPPEAVPRLSGPELSLESVKTYLERSGRVLRRGARILLGD